MAGTSMSWKDFRACHIVGSLENAIGDQISTAENESRSEERLAERLLKVCRALTPRADHDLK
jgi:hypothetical protein